MGTIVGTGASNKTNTQLAVQEAVRTAIAALGGRARVRRRLRRSRT